jgi:hypothetical protein
VIPEIMIPLIATKKELDLMKAVVDQVASEVSQMSGEKFEYLVGTMIELPRACLRAGEIAETAEFFSFGTNDLTQTTFGLSRDDSGSFLEKYQQRGILEHDPFASLDIEGVGELIEIGCERGRKTRTSLKVGICGEHGGDPASVFFCHKAGLDYVSCSPYPRADRAAGGGAGSPGRRAQDGMTLDALGLAGRGASARSRPRSPAWSAIPDTRSAQRLLDEAWRIAARACRWLTGPPGVGKSSLCAGAGRGLAHGRAKPSA